MAGYYSPRPFQAFGDWLRGAPKATVTGEYAGPAEYGDRFVNVELVISGFEIITESS
jgi:hypothetical protein